MSVAAFGLLNIDLIYSGVDRLPGPGEEIYYPDFALQLGGGPALLPIALKHFGLKTKLGTFLSNDFQSDLAKRLLADLGFNKYQNFYRKKNGSPVVVTSAISLKHDRCFVSHCGDGTGAVPSAATLYKFLRGSKICYASHQHPGVMKKLRAEGTVVVFDSGWEDQMRIQRYEEILKNVDFYTPNAKEAMKLTGTNSPEKAVRSLGKLVKFPVVTLGGKGCLALLDGKIIRVEMPCRFDAIDTTGAGDNFLAGLVYGLCLDWSIIDCLKMANIFGGISTTRLGCYAGLFSKTKRDLEKYMRLYIS